MKWTPSSLIRVFQKFDAMLIISIVFNVHFVKGLLVGSTGLMGTPLDFLLRSFKVQAANMQLYNILVFLPWSFKPMIGMISTVYPIGGQHKSPYMAITTIAALIGVGYIILCHSFISPSLAPCLGALVVFSLHTATCDLFTAGSYAVAVKKYPKFSADLMTFVSTGTAFCRVISVLCAGPILQRYGAFQAYAFCLPFLLATALPTFGRFLDINDKSLQKCDTDLTFDPPPIQQEQERDVIPQVELQVSENQKRLLVQDDDANITGNRSAGLELSTMSVIMGMACLSIGSISVLPIEMAHKTILALLIAALVGGSFVLLMRKEIAKLHIFFLLQSMLSLSTSGASFYFYTDTEEQFPAGPHFSILFYTTYIGIIHSIFGFLGISLYDRIGREWSYKKLIKFSGCASIITTTLRVVLFSRFNRRLGIYDEVIMGTSVAISSVISEFTWLGLSILISQSCPDSCETSLIALTSGCLNIGSDIGSILGAEMLNLASITPSGSLDEGEKFDNLWLCVLISGISPCIVLPFVTYLLPGSTPCEPLILVDPNDPCYESPWRKLYKYFRG